MIMPWANRILPAARFARNIPAEEEDTASVISVASSGATAKKRATETDSDASQPSEDDDQTDAATVVEVPTDEDESEPESEEEYELSEKEQRLLHEAYDTYATTGQQWTQERQGSSASCRTSFADAGNVRNVVEKLIDLPDSWPLMRILIPLDGLSLQVERIIACVAAELSATHLQAKTLNKFVKRVAKKLTAILACYLAGEVASILSPVAAIGHREMVAPMYHPLLTPVFWVRPIYMELLHASSRLRRDTRVETARPSTGLVKSLCAPKAQREGPINATLQNKGFAHWLGAICHAQSLYVWVPAHWAPCICTVVKNRTAEFDRKRDHETLLARAWGHEVEQQAQRDGAGIANATVVEGVAYFLRAVDLRPGIEDIPSLVISIRAPWLELPVAEFVNTMQTIYQGVLDGIFCQRPIAAWFSAQCKRIQMTIILPSSSSLDVWQNTLLRHTSCWPFRLPQTMASVRPPQQDNLRETQKTCAIQTYPRWAEDQLGPH